MTTPYYSYILASTYGSGLYNSNDYNGTNVTSSTGGSSGGGLSDTGVAVGLIVGLAALILLAAIVVRIVRRPGKQPKDDQPNQ